MAIVTADSLGIDNTGTTEVSTALSNGINALTSGDTFQFHANGSYLSNAQMTWTTPGIIIDGQGAAVFTNVRRGIYNPPGNDVNGRHLTISGSNTTLRNLRKYGFRSDVYTGNKLAVVTGTPTVNLTTMLLDAANEEVRLPQTPLDWFPQSTGPYHASETPFYFRDKDGNVRFQASMSHSVGGLTGDAVFAIVDDSNNTVLFSQAFTLTTGFATYTITWALPTINFGTRLRITIRKVSGTGTITIASITAYGEAGYRNYKGNQYTGGDEFSHGFRFGSGTNITIEDCASEGPDGDDYNLTLGSTNAILRRSTGRCAGRQGIVPGDCSGTLIQDVYERQVGRSGIDFEPNPNRDDYNTTVQRVTFEDVRNFTIGAGPWDRNHTFVMQDIVSINAGMGPWYGGAFDGCTVHNFHHTNTYRTEADRVLNGGKAGVDAIIFATGATFDDFTTDIGFWLVGPTSTGLPRPGSTDIHITSGRVTHPQLTPAYIIDSPSSSVEIIGGAAPPTKVWDDTTVFWDDPQVTWDGLIVGNAPPPPPPPATGTFRLKKSTGGSKLKGTDRLKGAAAPVVSRLFRLKRLAGGSRLKAVSGGDRLKFGSIPVVSLYGKVQVTVTVRGRLAPKVKPYGKVLVTNSLTGTPYKVKYARGKVTVSNTLRGTALATTPAVTHSTYGKIVVTNRLTALDPTRTANARGKVQVTNTLTAHPRLRRGPQPGTSHVDVVKLGRVVAEVGS